MRRLGLAFSGVPLSVMDMVQNATLAEKRGFDSVWVAEDYFLRDGFAPLACVAFATKKVKVGVGVINPYTRNPVLIAETIATIDEISKGRMILGLGTGVVSLIEQMGIEVQRPLQTVRESVDLIRRLLTEKETTYKGAVINVEKARFGANPYFDLVGRFRPTRKRIPIYVAAMGPKMLQLAGEIGDGVLFSVGSPVPYCRYAAENLKVGAAKANRDPSKIDVACYIACAPFEKGRSGQKVVRGFVSFMVSYASEGVLKMSNVDPSEALKIRGVLEKEGMAEAARYVSDEMVETFGAFGSSQTIIERIEEYVSDGVDLPILFPIPPGFRLSLEAGGRYIRSHG